MEVGGELAALARRSGSLAHPATASFTAVAASCLLQLDGLAFCQACPSTWRGMRADLQLGLACAAPPVHQLSVPLRHCIQLLVALDE